MGRFKGDMLVLKLVGGITPEALTVAEYQDFVFACDAESDHEEEDSDESDEESCEESDEEGADGMTPLEALLIERCITKFREEHGREPSDEELDNILQVMNEQ